MRFTLRHLQYFVAAAEASSIAAASQRIAVSPPSISAAIAHLEKELGLQLFIRHHAQGLSLTASGRQMLREAKALLAQADALHASARDLTEQARGPLNVGCLVTLAPIILPELCHAFQHRFPAVLVSIHEGDQEHLIGRLRRGEIDILLTYDLQVPEDVAFEALAQLPPYVLLWPEHTLAQRRSLSLHDLAPEPLILLDLPLSREYFLSLFFQEGLTPQVAARSTHPDVIRTMVANQYGYALFNARPRNDAALDGKPLQVVPLKGPYRPMSLGLASLRQSGRPRALIEFEEHCRVAINQRGIPGLVIQSK
ncbi:MAG TPA: LysR family transcriptional regulator [Dongiaceae bacterium]|nr:LysR family transcriptional regulator [Dongiaceae bacterium]